VSAGDIEAAIPGRGGHGWERPWLDTRGPRFKVRNAGWSGRPDWFAPDLPAGGFESTTASPAQARDA
jgi:hypothetical protein